MSLSLIIPLFLCLILLVIISGVEYAYLASNKLTIEIKRKSGSKSGLRLGKFFDDPERFWSGTVIGFYILLVCFCFLFSEATKLILAESPLGNFFEMNPYLHMLVDFFIASIIILISVGFIAKRTFENQPEGKLNTWSAFMNVISMLAAPFAAVFTNMSEFILKYLFNVKVNKKESIFERINTHQFFRQSIQGHGNMDETNKELFNKALQLTKVKVRKCMTPRNETIAVDIQSSTTELKKIFIDTKLSKIVIYETNLDNVIGYAHHLDLNHKPKEIKDILYPIPAVPETMSAIDLIHKFTKERKSIAWVIDEFGGTAGFVTMEDVLEEIFGDINDEYDIERFIEQQINVKEFLFAGRLEIEYLNKKYNLGFSQGDSETLSGFIIRNYGKIPQNDERLVIDNFEIETIQVSETKIETVRLRVLH